MILLNQLRHLWQVLVLTHLLPHHTEAPTLSGSCLGVASYSRSPSQLLERRKKENNNKNKEILPPPLTHKLLRNHHSDKSPVFNCFTSLAFCLSVHIFNLYSALPPALSQPMYFYPLEVAGTMQRAFDIMASNCGPCLASTYLGEDRQVNQWSQDREGAQRGF